MKVSRVIGVGLVALGIVLLYYGYTSTQSYIRVTGTYTAMPFDILSQVPLRCSAADYLT